MEAEPLTPVENLFHKLGLDTPISRFMAVTTAVEGLMLMIKPDAFFTVDGYAKPWSLFSNETNATSLPFWAPGIFFGIAASLLV